tara:strand:- start:66 stop:461 length:396 start_codon:yes stop_codon:yes gene_type:complete
MLQSQVIVYILVVIVTSAIVSYLSERPTPPQGIEGFTGSEENIEALNNEMSEKVSNMEDSLHMTKYKKDYENTLTYGKDYFDAMKVSALFDFSSIVNTQQDKEKMEQSCITLAKKLGALHEGARALQDTTL